jgi:sporulation protein YlmC with PRC-barrel domain
LTVTTTTDKLDELFAKACEFIDGEVYEKRGKVVCDIDETKITVRKDTLETKVVDEKYGLQRWDYLRNVSYYIYSPTRANIMSLDFKSSPSLTIGFKGAIGVITPPYVETVEEKLRVIGEDFKGQFMTTIERAKRARLARISPV